MVYKILRPGKDYYVNDQCLKPFEHLSEIDKDCKLYWDANLFEVKSTQNIAFEQSDDWREEYFFSMFNSAIDNTVDHDPRIDAYTLDGEECLGTKNASALYSLFWVSIILLFSY